MEPAFLTADEVLAIHRDQIERYGGSAKIRDEAALLSAVAMPRSGIADRFHHPDLPSMAAAYLFHVVANHPFVDGNKRVAIVSALIFLDLNSVRLDADKSEIESLVMGLAAGARDKNAAMKFFVRHCVLP